MEDQLTHTSKPSKKKLYRAWAMYDWANSAYNLVITSTIFPAYYVAVTSSDQKGPGSDHVSLWGMDFVNTALSNYALGIAYLVIAFSTPILSSIADIRGNKKSFMRLFCYMGSIACCGLYFFRSTAQLDIGILCFTIAAIGYCGSLVFYNAYLPEIAPEEQRDKLSAQGYAYGYIGSVLLQLICFVFVFKPEWFGWLNIHNEGDASRFSFLLVGVWWFGFSHITLSILPKSAPQPSTQGKSILTNGFHELGKVWDQMKQLPVLRTYLGAFFFYSIGVQTVMLAATNFGKKELKLETGQLIMTILIIQIVAIAGAYLMAKLSDKLGNLKVLLGVVLIWILVCIYAYFITTAGQFYFVAVVVGLVMGGIQSLSRSTYSKLMPETRDTASFFSFYDVTEKIAIVIGMFSFGFIEELTGSMRNSIIALVSFFAIGAIILYLAIGRAKREHLRTSVI
jgi:UMF1 family MFS transporter